MIRIDLLLLRWMAVAVCLLANVAVARTAVNVRVMAANLNGNSQSYQPFAIRIFQGLKPDVVAIQEFNYSNNADGDFRVMVDTALGTNFVYYREPYTGGNAIPNGIISRYPIVNAGSWSDAQQSSPNRGFAWAQIQLPGTNFLYVVSVHLLTSSAGPRAAEAAQLQSLIQANFPTNAWVVLAGDFNTDSRTETAMMTFGTFLSDYPVPVDNNGNSDTSQNRNHPHDYVLPSFALTNFETATVLPSHSFPSGLVFDSTVYTPLSDVAPVLYGDSTNAQHMPVLKDFLIPAAENTNPPVILIQPAGQTNAVGANVSFAVTATGGGLAYQWFFNGTNIAGATINPLILPGAQQTNAGFYSVVVSNLYGAVTSSNAVLVLTNAAPTITAQPQSVSVLAGQPATFSVTASGTPPLGYQWLFNSNILAGATSNVLSLGSIIVSNVGSYVVVVTNNAGSVTSQVAMLTLASGSNSVIAQWNFNSTPPDGSTSTGNTTPSVGSGTASLAGGTSATFASGDTAMDPAPAADNTGWNTSTYPASGNNKTAGAQFAVSTAGYRNISVSWSQRSSGTGGKYFRLQYSTNGGASFLDYPSAITVSTSFTPFTNDLSALAGTGNNSNFVFRIVGEFQSTATGSGTAGYVGASSTYASSGTSRFDMVTVAGTPIPLATAAVMTSPGMSGGQFGFAVSGTDGASYVVQATTNLTGTNWVSMATNVPPFNFSDGDPAGPQRFYRVIAQ